MVGKTPGQVTHKIEGLAVGRAWPAGMFEGIGVWQEAGWLGWASTQDGEELEVAMIASQRHDGYKQRVIWHPGRKEVIWEQSPGERCWWVVW